MDQREREREREIEEAEERNKFLLQKFPPTISYTI